MANRTVRDARSIKGKNPQYLVEKITRSRIYESRYWKEECFALSAELLVDKAMELRFIGGTYGGNIKPSPFLCLLLKMLQIQPEKDIVIEFIKNEDFKYVRCLGALYIRLVGEGLDVYKYLEPLYNDYRKIRRQDKIGGYFLSHVDEFIDELLNEERVCDIILPRVQKRHILEETEQLELRVSPLEEDLDDMEDSSDDDIDIPVISKVGSCWLLIKGYAEGTNVHFTVDSTVDAKIQSIPGGRRDIFWTNVHFTVDSTVDAKIQSIPGGRRDIFWTNVYFTVDSTVDAKIQSIPGG
eukprot:XP_011670966.1 PREDICTED: pre-mRNA-splicing factor 38A [Strongylocentrotus purpuratus]